MTTEPIPFDLDTIESSARDAIEAVAYVEAHSAQAFALAWDPRTLRFRRIATPETVLGLVRLAREGARAIGEVSLAVTAAQDANQRAHEVELRAESERDSADQAEAAVRKLSAEVTALRAGNAEIERMLKGYAQQMAGRVA